MPCGGGLDEGRVDEGVDLVVEISAGPLPLLVEMVGGARMAGALFTLLAVLSESTLATCFPIFILPLFIPSPCLSPATIHAQSSTNWLMIFLSSPR